MKIKNLQPIPENRSASTTIFLTGFSVICLSAAILFMLITLHTLPEITPTPDNTTIPLPAVTQIEDPVITALNILCKCSVAVSAILLGFHTAALAYSIFIQKPCFRHWIEYPILFLNFFITLLCNTLLPPLCTVHFGLTAEITQTIPDLLSTISLLAIITFVLLLLRDFCNLILDTKGDENEA